MRLIVVERLAFGDPPVDEVVERGFLVLETDFEFDNCLSHAVLPTVAEGSGPD